ncbi:stage III sporulation protein AA [Oceanobacillus polygoni]|uniref:Stage III sporulation protein AA n=1 Tax=Oceanobacillus polygoni TaxID=1235259 RepID=A0A9X1CCN5_9BACI|nr:stage III sporulation protein AA [Oceanobacillus polygoni]MBP2078221.1 stage III sporulation protein AA [Oceanobacillus polygoni]
MDEIMCLFPNDMRQAIQLEVKNRWQMLQEIRVRLNRPIELIFDDTTEWVKNLTPQMKEATYLINQLSQFSLYRLEDELREGYITIEGGHRVGIAGKVTTTGSHVKAIQDITFFNIRIAKEKPGVALPIIPHIYRGNYLNTLIIGPPQTGKTTLIRDLTRLISNGSREITPKKVGVVDERSEIGASIKGIPQHNLGLRTDVMDACPKADGMMMLVRSMSPDVMVVDEIGNQKDIDALMEAVNTGVTVICSIHGGSVNELKRRPSLKPIFNQHIFERFIVLKRDTSPGRISQVLDQNENNLFEKSRGVTDEVDWSTAFNRHSHLGRI